jgi:hypothetical protein
MKNIQIFTISIIFLCCSEIHAQQRVSGFVKDASSGEFLIGATVFDIENKGGAVTNQAGYFSLITKPNAMLRISYLGYESQEFSVCKGEACLTPTILLKPAQTTLGGIEISAQYRPTFNVAKLNTNEILNIPNITGKPDVLKALQLLPGMRSPGEATSGILVRGGNPGENLYLLDNTPLIYVHHIGGHMSVFNPDMINDIEVYKGGFPAKYGEKLSSIMNITQKSGNQSAFRGSYSIGISDLSLTLEGPTKLDNSSFIFTARKTLVTELFYLAATGISSETSAFMFYGFHDVNGKFTWSPNYRNTFSVNFYQGDDYLQQFGKTPKRVEEGRFRKSTTWGNWLGSVNWNHAFPSNWLVKNTISFTHYRLKDVLRLTYSDKQIEQGAENLQQMKRSSLQDISWRSEVSYTLIKNWDLEFGNKLTHLRFKPMIFEHNTPGIPQHNDFTDALESAIYVTNKIKPISFLDAEIGLRGVSYFNSEISNFSLEPRLNTNIYLTENHVLNLSAMRVSQNAQLISNIGSLSANEIFIPSGKDIPISYSNQFSFGYHTSFLNKRYHVEANVFHKTLNDLTTYKDGYNYAMGDIYWREKLETGGTGLAQGFEFLLKKNSGRLTGFLGYTYSKSTRQFAGINNGKTYDFEYDSPHDLSINLAFQLSEKWSFGTTWQYQTGLPFTPAIGRHIALDDDGSPYEVLIYGDKNSERMRDYHRLDIAFKKKTYTKKKYREDGVKIKKPNRKSELTLGVYNVYARQNPYFYFYSNSSYGLGGIYWHEWATKQPIKLYQASMFSLIPMISYKVWFGADSKKTWL